MSITRWNAAPGYGLVLRVLRAGLAANPGVLFWRDDFHVKDSVIRGMHGYLDKADEQYGMAVLASSDGSLGPDTFEPRPRVDIFPTLCDLLGLPVPETSEGDSVVVPQAKVIAVSPERRPRRKNDSPP